MKENRFRKDLNYRLQTHRIVVPPLRDRLDDVPLLVDHFIAEAASSLNKPRPSVPDALLTLLTGYFYPGNVRELESMIFDAVSRHQSGPLSMASIQAHVDREQTAGGSGASSTAVYDFGDPPITFSHRLPTLKEAAQLLVAEAMRRSGGNQSKASKMLGVSQQALSKRAEKGKRLTLWVQQQTL